VRPRTGTCARSTELSPFRAWRAQHLSSSPGTATVRVVEASPFWCAVARSPRVPVHVIEDAAEPLLPDRVTGALGRWHGAGFGTWSFAGRCFVRHLANNRRYAIVRETTEVGWRIPSRRRAVLLVKQPTPSHRPFEIAPKPTRARTVPAGGWWIRWPARCTGG